MITSNLTGNFGNHMFIYSLTRTVAEFKGFKWGFNPITEYDYYGGTPQINFLEVDYGETHDYKYSEIPSWITFEWKEKFERRDGYDYYPFQADIFDIQDCTKMYIPCGQDARYYNKEKLLKWFKIREENKDFYKAQLKENGIILDENLTVINIRGGEYRGVPSLILRKEYWQDAIKIMKDRNPKMKFICITDDISYGNNILDFKIPVMHFSIGGDYYVINNAKNLILSNSSFAIFPTWLNDNDPFVIAPRYWARHNVSTGYWCGSDIWTFGWKFLDRDGLLYEK